MIKEALTNIKNQLPENVTLVAVSKTKPVEDILEAYNTGHRVFGENKVQEMTAKHEELPKDIEWHMIGHLQSNKVKYIAPFVSLIHSVDSLKLLKEINKQAKKNDRIINVLLQFHIADEQTKFGFDLQEVQEMFESDEFIQFENVSIVGVMGMATNTDDEEKVRDEFRTLENYFNVLQGRFFKFNPAFKEISMGMSSDYEIAVAEGSTMIRVGSSIFGHR